MLYSFVIPCFNSGETISNVVKLTAEEMDKMERSHYEFILVNDCSPDGGKTINILKNLVMEYPFVKVVDLAKNSGQHNAILAGLHYAEGDIIIGMDDDMQTHPSQLPVLFEKFEEGYDIVYGYYPEKKHSFIRNIASKLNYWSVRVLIGKPKELKTSSYWVMKKFVRDYIITYKFSYPYLQGMFLNTTSNIGCTPIKHFARAEGKSNYTFKRLFKLWSGIMGFSTVPLRLSLTLGNILALGGFIGVLATIIHKIVNPNVLIGWASTMCVMCFFSGVILFFIGLVGEYIGRMFLSVSNEPQFVVREVIRKEESE